MNSYIITQEITITRQEGDTGVLQFVVPNILNPANFDITFQVWRMSRENSLLFKKEDWTVEGQQITTSLTEADTKGFAGRWRWEMQFTSAVEIITVGRGAFEIIKELIP